ncbi:MAG: PQQ-binding-like beta-propeller repeat protein [Verrucomicrobia bacterium]|nr:PQQ-binding-like beta-propeller repeat protein [Verrucomicrobiota bacterium]
MFQSSFSTLRLFTLLTLSISATWAADWNQWRGPSRDGQVPKSKWPESLGEQSLTETWRVDLSPSYSGPIVVGERVFTTETSDKETETVRALDRKTGKELWKQSWAGSISVPFFAKANGDWIRATPACDGESLYVAGIRDVLVCLNASTGAVRWRVDFVEQLKTAVPSFGFVSSPLVDGDAVYVQAGGGVVKLAKATGKILWRSLDDGGGMSGSAFSSPIIAELCNVRQLVVQTREKLAGLSITDGKVLWEQPVEAFRGMNILTPLISGNKIFTSTYGGQTLLYEITRKEGTYEIATLWSLKAQGYMCSPVVVDGVAYEHLKNQRVMAVDLKTGKELWTTEKGYGKYWSLVANGHRILALDQRGSLHLFKANPEKYEELDQRKISDKETWAHLAVSGNEIFIRELNALTAWRWSE